MSTPTPATPVAFKFDEAKFTSHLNAIKEEQLTYAGKHNHNPFLWIANNVRPLETLFAKGDRSESLYTKALALKSEKPVVNPDICDVEAAKTSATAEPKAPTVPQGATGLSLPKK